MCCCVGENCRKYQTLNPTSCREPATVQTEWIIQNKEIFNFEPKSNNLVSLQCKQSKYKIENIRLWTQSSASTNMPHSTQYFSWRVFFFKCNLLMWMKLTAGENETHYCQKTHTWTQRGLSFALLQCPASGLSLSPPHQHHFWNTREAIKLYSRKKCGFVSPAGLRTSVQ